MLPAAQTNRSPLPLPIDVFVDFDGTIAPDDPTDTLFARFADPYWLEIEAEWQKGLITSSEAMARQVGLIRATPEDISEFLAGIRIDPDFPDHARQEIETFLLCPARPCRACARGAAQGGVGDSRKPTGRREVSYWLTRLTLYSIRSLLTGSTRIARSVGGTHAPVAATKTAAAAGGRAAKVPG